MNSIKTVKNIRTALDWLYYTIISILNSKAPLSNILINPITPGQIINQRALAVYSVVNQYTIDRWKLVSGTLTVNVGSGSITMPESITLNGIIRQIIEFPQSYAGKTVTISVVEATISINGGDFAENVTVTLPPTLSSLYVEIKGENSNSSQAQLVFSESVQPFNPRPLGIELALCLRYYETIGIGTIGETAASNAVVFTNTFKVTKRTSPSVNLFSNSMNVSEVGIRGLTGTNLSYSGYSISLDGFEGQVSGFTGMTVGSTVMVRSQKAFYADAEL